MRVKDPTNHTEKTHLDSLDLQLLHFGGLFLHLPLVLFVLPTALFVGIFFLQAITKNSFKKVSK
jgi:hypothetical protein